MILLIDDEDFDPEKGFVKNNEWEEEDKDLKESEVITLHYH